jgi:hypothetical protein
VYCIFWSCSELDSPFLCLGSLWLDRSFYTVIRLSGSLDLVLPHSGEGVLQPFNHCRMLSGVWWPCSNVEANAQMENKNELHPMYPMHVIANGLFQAPRLRTWVSSFKWQGYTAWPLPNKFINSGLGWCWPIGFGHIHLTEAEIVFSILASERPWATNSNNATASRMKKHVWGCEPSAQNIRLSIIITQASHRICWARVTCALVQTRLPPSRWPSPNANPPIFPKLLQNIHLMTV